MDRWRRRGSRAEHLDVEQRRRRGVAGVGVNGRNELWKDPAVAGGRRRLAVTAAGGAPPRLELVRGAVPRHRAHGPVQQIPHHLERVDHRLGVGAAGGRSLVSTLDAKWRQHRLTGGVGRGSAGRRGTVPTPKVSPGPVSTQSAPIATRSTMSTTSSPGRRPFGKPALSPPRTPRRFCAPTGDRRDRGVEAQHLRRRRTLAGWLSALEPVRKRRRGRCAGSWSARCAVGEQRLEQRRQRRVGHVVGELARRPSACRR